MPSNIFAGALTPLAGILNYLRAIGGTGKDVRQGLAAWPADLPGSVADLAATPIEGVLSAAGETFPPLRNTFLNRIVPGQTAAAIRRNFPGGTREATPAQTEWREQEDEEFFSPYNVARMANPALWYMGFNPSRWPKELMQGVTQTVSPLARLAAEGVDQASKGELPGALGAVLSPLSAARMNVIRDPGGQFSPRTLNSQLKGLKNLRGRGLWGPYEGFIPYGPTTDPVTGEVRNWMDPVSGEIVSEAEKEAWKIPSSVNKWIDTQLRRYITRDLGSPADPILQMAQRGEPIHMNRDLLHQLLMDEPRARLSDAHQLRLAYDPSQSIRELGWGANDPGLTTDQYWGAMADTSLLPTTARKEFEKVIAAMTPQVRLWHWDSADELLASMRAEGRDLNPAYKFLERLDPKTPMWQIRSGRIGNELGFDHIIDVLSEKLTTGELDPARLNRVSVADAVKMTADYDATLAKRMGAAAAKREAEMPVLKAYPQVEGQEKPWRWVELNKPGAFADESDRMGHSVRGYEPPRNHPDWVKESGNAGSLQYGFNEGWEGIKKGGAKVLSLRGPDGKSYVTVEARKVLRDDLAGYYPGENSDPQNSEFARLYEEKNGPGSFSELLFDGERKLLTPKQFRDIQANTEDIWDISHWLALNRPDLVDPSWYHHVIQQIKGPQNAAPAKEAIPYVQDLVRNMGPWAKEIGDFQNTGLLRRGGSSIPWPRNTSYDMAQKLTQHPDWKKFEESWPELMTEQEAQELIKAFAKEKFPKMKFSEGGSVDVPDNDVLAWFTTPARPTLDDALAEMMAA